MKIIFRYCISGIFLLFVLGGCERERTVIVTEPKSTTTTTTETLTFNLEGEWRHLGDENRPDFHKPWGEGASRSYDFRLEGRVRSATLEIEFHDLDNIGATVTLNGVTIASFTGVLSGSRSVSISAAPFVQGTNTLKVQANASDSQREDFEYRNLKLVVTVER